MAKVLIPNRGEIAVRLIRAAAECGMASVLAASDPDQSSLAARLADEVVKLPGVSPKDTYLNVDAILEAADRAGATLVHPGYGFLSENAAFGKAVQDAGLTWVGPDPAAIDLMGAKTNAIAQARSAGVPTIPGSDGIITSVEEAARIAGGIGYPIAIKAAGGGGGRGIRIVETAADFANAWERAGSEAASSFGDDRLYLEKYIPRARHIEVQILGDGRRAVHLFERDCSLQRRRQKIIEESPAPGISEPIRQEMCQAAVNLAASVDYTSAGTVEFLYDVASREFYFLEMNTRIQVEHPITESCTVIDIAREQLRIAQGHPLSVRQDDIQTNGHIIEIRVNAEDPNNKFFPSPGKIDYLSWPGGPGIRVDAGVGLHDTVTPYYDSLLAKLIIRDYTRREAIVRATRALREIRIEGLTHTGAFSSELINTSEFIHAQHHTGFVEDYMERRDRQG
ncbi:MAG: ATP-grasp domain-containing protein [Propionibacteriaceae bacterium]|jgi:acetyl-CoA carboxylase biotin carboxylase subunit|nr:ATP-grasp domain-containing protein [Propionibacteriaceae bacterium]